MPKKAHAFLPFNAGKQPHTQTDTQQRALLPNSVTSLHHPLRDAGGGSPQQAQLNARSQESLRCCVLATRDGGRENCLCNTPGSFWRTNN